MTVLQRTDLTTSQKIQCAAAAVAGQHAHGSKTALSETYEISRPTVYAVGAAAESVLRSHFETPLLQGAAVDVRVDDAQLRRAVPLACTCITHCASSLGGGVACARAQRHPPD